MNTGNNRPYAAYQQGAQPAHAALGDTIEHGARLKRLILVGALASFVSLFGLTVAFDFQTQHGQTALPAIVTGSQPVANGSGYSSKSAAPQIRTKTS